MDTLKEYNITDINFNKLSLEEKIKILNIKTKKDYDSISRHKIMPRLEYFLFGDNDYIEAYKIIEYNNKPKEKIRVQDGVYKSGQPKYKYIYVVKEEKKIVAPKPLNLFIPDNIKEDYKHFNTKYDVSRSKNQDNRIDYNKLNIKYLLNNFDYMTIYITKQLHNDFIKDNEIINFDIYECLLFNNIIINNIDEYSDKKMVNQYYTESFRPYFYEKYKSQLKVINIDDERKLKIFDKIYKKVIINKYKKKDNPKEYNNYSCNKKNLKNSYKMYLEGMPIEDIPNKLQLQMILYIMDNCDTN